MSTPVQHVSYFQNNIVYEHGPFVVCDLSLALSYRIEVELPGHYTSVLTHPSVYAIQKRLGYEGNTKDRTLVDGICRTLNRMVEEGSIVLRNGQWVAAE